MANVHNLNRAIKIESILRRMRCELNNFETEHAEMMALMHGCNVESDFRSFFFIRNRIREIEKKIDCIIQWIKLAENGQMPF